MTKLAAASAGQDVLARLQKAEEELAALRKELEHSQQLATLGTLTAGIAHEINNILTPVLAYAQLARSSPHDTALRAKALDRAVAGVESASRITEAVLGFARNDDEGRQARIAEVIDTTLACLGRDPARDGITLLVEVDPEAHVSIRPLALQQVLLNLILNALTALYGQRGELRITASKRDDGMTQIAIVDTGPGIPQKMAATIFEPFVSSHSNGVPSPTGHGGSGLGLAVCKRLIEQSGGTIVLEPPGKAPKRAGCGPGAAFTITLPTFDPPSTTSTGDQKSTRSPKKAA